MISTWARQDWAAFTAALTGGDRTLSQARLQSFLLGVAYREEELSAHELAELLDHAGLSGQARAELADDVEFGLGLLVAYGRLLGEDEDDGNEDGPGEFPLARRDPGIGDLLI